MRDDRRACGGPLYGLLRLAEEGETRRGFCVAPTRAREHPKLYAQPGVVGGFQDQGVRYRRRKEDEESIRVHLGGHASIPGLTKELVA